MGRKRKDSSRTVIDPKLLPTNITPPPPPPPDLKLQVRGNPTSGYRVCTYFARWRPVVKETDSTPRKEGSCVATHVKTVGYIEKHKRSGKIIFVPDFYLEVPRSALFTSLLRKASISNKNCRGCANWYRRKSVRLLKALH